MTKLSFQSNLEFTGNYKTWKRGCVTTCVFLRVYHICYDLFTSENVIFFHRGWEYYWRFGVSCILYVLFKARNAFQNISKYFMAGDVSVHQSKRFRRKVLRDVPWNVCKRNRARLLISFTTAHYNTASFLMKSKSTLDKLKMMNYQYIITLSKLKV